MRAMADSLGHEDVFEELQTDNYWWVLLRISVVTVAVAVADAAAALDAALHR
jgi:hypothetical protein